MNNHNHNLNFMKNKWNRTQILLVLFITYSQIIFSQNNINLTATVKSTSDNQNIASCWFSRPSDEQYKIISDKTSIEIINTKEAALVSGYEHVNKLTARNPQQIFSLMKKVANWQMEQNTKYKPTDWTLGALYTGMVAFAKIANEQKYISWLLEVGNKTQWKEGARRFDADDYCVGHTYCELYDIYKQPYMLKPMIDLADTINLRNHDESLEWVNNIRAREWAWCDALFMGPPTLAAIYKSSGQLKYLDLMSKLWWKTTEYLYDKEEHLYFRDSRFFNQLETNGKKTFWSRGNGWVFAGLARVLEKMPLNYPERTKFVKLFKEMAEKLISLQQPDGSWHASLLNPESTPSKETSGTGFFCFGLAWGINNGILEKEKYYPAVEKAWNAMVESVHDDGKLGFVQKVGDRPGETKLDDTEVYGVGALLLAGTELIKLANASAKEQLMVKIENQTGLMRENEIVEIVWNKIETKLKFTNLNQLIVENMLTGEQVPVQIISNENQKPQRLLFLITLAPGNSANYSIKQGTRAVFEPKTFGRFVPERKDDFAWENDKIAHRMYGPALQATGEISSGIDVWVKSTDNLIIDKWYKLNNYHSDHGEGLDGYKVGPTLGAGGLAPFSGGKLYYSKNFVNYKVLANGPIRTIFELKYAPWDVNGRQISETKTISIDAGSNLSKFEIVYESANKDTIQAAIGILKRAEPGTVTLDEVNNLISYWEPEHPQNGTTGLGIVPLNSSKGMLIADNHYITTIKVLPGSKFYYYSGACWSKKGDFQNAQQWTSYLLNVRKKIENPLIITIK